MSVKITNLIHEDEAPGQLVAFKHKLHFEFQIPDEARILQSLKITQEFRDAVQEYFSESREFDDWYLTQVDSYFVLFANDPEELKKFEKHFLIMYKLTH